MPCERSLEMEVGVDGCKNGWAAVSLEGGEASGDLFRSIEALSDAYQTASLVLIDMPIGLREAGGEWRRCGAIWRLGNSSATSGA
jgi:predicted RNase H-like nuclease